ncbi:hypothetical protein EYC80_000566 [Monilinia laxa]|uniref:Superoxide dismutase [Cu-Zn] n=1 Tax=Monilinia laxa TaxID=61186 RepID=A0A5N6KB12_MONLA|nr:hypothetical protein EYC80_000566 [Monilinia laxa]
MALISNRFHPSFSVILRRTANNNSNNTSAAVFSSPHPPSPTQDNNIKTISKPSPKPSNHQFQSQFVKMVKAVATVRGDSKVSGTITFEQANESSPTTVSWNISGNDPNAERGFHIHQFGDNTNGCTSAGPHFNPHGQTHGAPTDEVRHVVLSDVPLSSTPELMISVRERTKSLRRLVTPEPDQLAVCSSLSIRILAHY